MRRFTLLAVLVCAISVVPSAGAIIGGSPDGDAHPYVAFAGVRLPNGQSLSCSATFVSPTVAITAAHCFPPGSSVLVFPYALGPRDGRPPVVGQFIPHPDFCKPPACQGGELKDFVTDDVAVIKLSQPVALPRYAELPKVEKSQGRGKVQKLVKKDVQVVGFGVQAFVPQPVSDLARTVATEEIASPDPVVEELFVQIDQDASGFCLGDSGGPVLEKRKDVVIAISSFVEHETTCLGPSFSYRLDSASAQSFIGAYLR
jgi:hypothetical protein